LTKTYSSPFPILFVCDFNNGDMVVPEYDETTIVSSNDTCVSVRTIADVDGSVTVSLSTSLPREAALEGHIEFAGVIKTPSGKVAAVTSENVKLLEIEVGADRTRLEVAVDDDQHPSRVWIAAKRV
jgi:hypothetical protein